MKKTTDKEEEEKKAHEERHEVFKVRRQSISKIALHFVVQKSLGISLVTPKKREIPLEKLSGIVSSIEKNNNAIRNHENAINICNELCMEIWPVQLNSIRN